MDKSEKSDDEDEDEFGDTVEPISEPKKVSELPVLEEVVIEKVDFKPMMKIHSTKDKKLVSASLEEQKKRNVIDKPIVDIEDCYSDDNELEKEKVDVNARSMAVKSRFGKLMSITDDTT